MDDRIAARPFHIMAKPKGAICNLDCTYGFFLKTEELYPGSKFTMSDEVMRSYIRQTIESQPSPHVTIAWQDREPTMRDMADPLKRGRYADEIMKPDSRRSPSRSHEHGQ